MNYNEAKAKLEAVGQTQLLRYYDELDPDAAKDLLDQIERTDFSVVDAIAVRDTLNVRGVISPIDSMELPEIEKHAQQFRKTGLEAIRAGQVGAVMRAGGMGTRLGSDNPKGMYDIGLTKHVYIFQRLVENLLDVVREAGTWVPLYIMTSEKNNDVPLYIMTSEKNNDATVGFFKEMDYFGYDPSFVHFFKQDMAPATDYEGHVYLEGKGRIATSPNGNAGWFISMEKAGLAREAKEKGVKWLNVFAVDNVLQRMADPLFVGAVIEGGYVSGSKVVRKVAKDEKVGAICLEDGKPSIVEYYDMTEELMDAVNEKGDLSMRRGILSNLPSPTALNLNSWCWT